jgi:hypothetical protein
MRKRTIAGVALLLCLLGAYVMSASPAQAATTHAKAVAPFSVTSVEMTILPADLSTWACGSQIQVIYNAIFHVNSGPDGGVITFSYTSDNGMSQTDAVLTIIPGQNTSNFTWTWEGTLPADHTMPGAGGVMVTSPNVITSPTISPGVACT